MLYSRKKRGPVDGPFYKQRGWINSAMALGLLLVLSLVAIVSDPEGTDNATGSREVLAGLRGPLSPGDPQQVRSGPGGRPGNCHTNDRDRAGLTAARADVRWRKLTAIMVPTSPSAGPLRTGGIVWWCFAHTPAGAVLAAHIILVELSGPDWRPAAEQQIVPGRPRDRLVTRRAEDDTTGPDGAVARFAGYSLASYSGDSATVRLLLSSGAGGYLSTSVSVRFRDGDWKVAPNEDGSLYSSVEPATPGGFVMWGA
ncbi:hypothetical protein [Streptomyces sp. NRRL S-813]|uniref:hypothetical protein n=1 Tax=Streptomyces sp. NRRL S-813 TaxID=1463919 RepID=UPI0004BE5B0E|nr:hypothetical protein [Streptomyces sp. NRRL S-813]